jgi:hypothetical protein
MHRGLIGLLPDGAAARVEIGSVLGGASMAMREGGRFGADDGGRLLSSFCLASRSCGPGVSQAMKKHSRTIFSHTGLSIGRRGCGDEGQAERDT